MNKLSRKLKLLMQIVKAGSVIARKFNGMGLGFGDLFVLYAISQAPEGKIRRIDLADEVGLTASGVTRLLVPLEKIGVVKREANARDARVSYVSLTKAGKEMFENSMKWMEMKCEDLIPGELEKKIEPSSALLESIAR